MTDSTDKKTIDLTTYRQYGRRIFIVIALILSPIIIGIFFTLISALRNLGTSNEDNGDVIFSTVILVVLCIVPFAIYQVMMKTWPFVKAKQQYPNEPWMWRQDWAEREIPYSRLHNVIGFWVGWIIVTAVGFGLIAWFATALADLGIPPLWLYAAAGVISIWVGISALVETRRWQKFGTTYCRLLDPTGVLGGWLRTRIELPVALVQGDSAQATLRLLFKSSEGSDKSKLRTVWRIDRTIPFDEMEIKSNRATFVPVDLYVPQDIGVDLDGGIGLWGSHHWRLDVNAKLIGLDYAAQFKVPVFKTPESSLQTPPEAIEQFGKSVDSADSFRPPEDIQVTPFEGGIEIRKLKTLRLKKYVVTFTIIGSALIGSAIFDVDGLFGFVKVISMLVGGFFILLWADEIYSYHKVLLTPAGAVRKARFIFYNRDRTIPINEIREVWIESQQRSSGGQYHRVDIKSKDSPATIDPDGPPPEKLQAHWVINIKGITVADGIDKKAQARWLKELVDGYLAQQPGFAQQPPVLDDGPE
jgi:hypothetical protein